MPIFETIYTSCRVGFEGSNSGLQVYTRTVGQADSPDQITRFYGYEYPRTLSDEPSVTEIREKCPVRYEYRMLDGGRIAMASSCYIGKDYMGDLGRYGNYINHIMTADISDLRCYPAQYYKSGMFRERLTPEEGNRSSPPAPLPPREALESGTAVTLAAIKAFLSVGDRMDVFKKMLAALIHAMENPERVIIVDDKDSIMQWIGAMQMFLPLRNAVKIPFSSYEFQPEGSYAKICGALKEGTIFSADTAMANPKLKIFDCYTGRYPDIDTEPYAPLLSAAEMAFGLFDGYLDPFHAFLDANRYDGVGRPILGAYLLYSMIEQGIDSVSLEQMREAVDFANTYGTEDVHDQLVDRILGSEDALSGFSLAQADMVCAFLCDTVGHARSDQRRGEILLFIQRVLMSLLWQKDTREDEYLALYGRVRDALAGAGIDLDMEMLYDAPGNGFLRGMHGCCSLWRNQHAVGLFAKYLRESRLQPHALNPQSRENQLITQLVQNLDAIDTAKGNNELGRFVCDAAASPAWLITLGYAADTVLHRQVPAMWGTIAQRVADSGREYADEAIRTLFGNGYDERVYDIFKLQLAHSRERAGAVFRQHWYTVILQHEAYRNTYASRCIADYLAVIEKLRGDQRLKAYRSLFILLKDSPASGSIMADVIGELVAALPLTKPTNDTISLINDILTCCREGAIGCDTTVLYLLKTGSDICAEANRPGRRKAQIGTFFSQNGINCAKLSDQQLDDYVSWMLLPAFSLCGDAQDLDTIFRGMGLSPDQRSGLTGSLTRYMLKAPARERSAGIYIIVSYCCGFADRTECDALASRLAKMPDKALDSIGGDVLDYARTGRERAYWGAVMDVVEEYRSKTLLGKVKGMLKKDSRKR